MTPDVSIESGTERSGRGLGKPGAVGFPQLEVAVERLTPFVRVLHGDALDQLGYIPADSVDCVITSPPYWGLRDYELPPQIWGGSDFCAHSWDPEGFCYACRGWRGQFGLEPTLNLYLEHLVETFREVRRVLKSSGVLWLNLGDAYNSGTSAPRRPSEGSVSSWRSAGAMGDRRVRVEGFKVKDLLGLAWRAALALQRDGWYLRSDVIWAKPNPLPEGVRDRPVRSHEYVFLLTKSPRYFYDAEAVRQPGPDGEMALGRRQLSVWSIPTQPYRGAHFATFPEQLVERCVKSGTSLGGCCPHCGAPWHRRTRIAYRKVGGRTTNGPRSEARRHESPGFPVRVEKVVETIGWEPECSCGEPNPVPAVVLDPFAGSGTTLAVARRLGRSAIGIELSRPYLGLIEARTASAVGKGVTR